MNETSQVTKVGANGRSSQSRWRTLIRSSTVTRGSSRSRGCELSVADVERRHARGTRLEEHIGEPARRRADVEAVLAGHVDVERLERVRELLAAARDEARPAATSSDGDVVDLLAGLVVPGHAPREDERLGLRTALGEPALDEEDVEPLLHSALA